jgi:hypothetical protein
VRGGAALAPENETGASAPNVEVKHSWGWADIQAMDVAWTGSNELLSIAIDHGWRGEHANGTGIVFKGDGQGILTTQCPYIESASYAVTSLDATAKNNKPQNRGQWQV